MNKKVCKILLIAVLVFVMTMPMMGCSLRDYEFQEEDFFLEIVASQTTASVGDTIEITATFRNLSGKNIRIDLICNVYWINNQPFPVRGIEQILSIDFVPYTEYYFRGYCAVAHGRMIRTLRNNAIIQRTWEFQIEKIEDYIGVAWVAFYAGRDFDSRVSIKSNIIVSVI